MTWLDNGAIDDTPKDTINDFEKAQIKKYEDFFNDKSIKNQVTARYIYEHLFLAHISFDDNSKNFFQIIRSSTPSGTEAKIIPTRFPYDEIKEKFYYRLQKVEGTIVHKTHMVVKFNDEKLRFYKDTFIKPNWEEGPYLISYNEHSAPNALAVFEQIPAKSRYEFLLNDIYFFINSFIKGPVCKGQVALNVIQDHFWVMFMDPKYDVSVIDKNFLKDNFEYLKIPNQLGEDPGLFETFKNLGHEKETYPDLYTSEKEDSKKTK
jgi:hypothetical protein